MIASILIEDFFIDLDYDNHNLYYQSLTEYPFKINKRVLNIEKVKDIKILSQYPCPISFKKINLLNYYLKQAMYFDHK